MSTESLSGGLPDALYLGLQDALSNEYQLLGEIGRGSSAVVFRAVDRKLRRPVAIKVLRPEIVSGAGSERFEREISVAAALSHAHIVAIHASGEAAGLSYYVMPLVEGESLRQRLSRERQLPLDEALRITRDIGGALQYAHEEGLVHRDVKPENVLLGAGGESALADFGLARVLQDEVSPLTASGIAVGTASYMSPEQASGDAVDARTDQYSLACVLFEMLAGVPPFHAATAHGILARHRSDPPPHIRHLRHTVPQGIDDAIVKAMAKLPADRYPNVADFVKALEVALTAETLATVRRRPRERRLTKRGLVRAGIVFAGLAAAGFSAWHRWKRGPDTHDRDPNRLVVAPFDVLDPADSVWRLGLVYVLSRNMDGVGQLRSVPPGVVAREWAAQPGGLSPRELSERTGAGLALYGQVLREAGDAMRLRVSLVDIVADRSLAEVEIAERSPDLLQLTDSATILVLGKLSQTRRIAYVGAAGFLTRSLTALKAFLRGEQYYRANDFSVARQYYEAAIAEDSGFAVALRRLAAVRRAVSGELDSLAFVYARRAGDLNHGLGRRDSLLILADSLAAARPPSGSFFDVGEQRVMRRRLQALEVITREYPSDPDARVELAEAWYHFGQRVGIGEQDMRRAFENAITSEPSYGHAYYHAVELTLAQLGPDSARRLTLNYLRVLPADRRFQIVRDLLSGDAAARRRVEPLLHEVAPDSLLDAADVLGGSLGSDGGAERIYRALLSRRDVLGTDDEDETREFYARQLLRNGRPAAAAAIVHGDNARGSPSLTAALAQAGEIDPGKADSIFGAAMRASTRPRILSALSWFGPRGTVTALRDLGQADRAQSGATTSDSTSYFRRYVASAAQAYLALATRDSAGALRIFVALPDSFCASLCQPQRIQAAQLLRKVGRARDAAMLLDRFPTRSGAPDEPVWRLTRADVALVLGDVKRARREYEAILAAFVPDDDWARGISANAQAGLGRLRRLAP